MLKNVKRNKYKKINSNNLIIYNDYEYVKNDNGLRYRRKIGTNSWRRICDNEKCMSIAKGGEGLCIKHQRNHICNAINCKKHIIKTKYKFCPDHISKIKNNNINDNIVNIIDKNNLINYNYITKYNEEIFNYWKNYYINSNDNVSTKCQGFCCSFYKDEDKPEGKFCKIENRYFCNLCSIF